MTVSPEASDQQASRPWQHCHSLHCLCNENQCLITTPLLESAMDPPTPGRTIPACDEDMSPRNDLFYYKY